MEEYFCGPWSRGKRYTSNKLADRLTEEAMDIEEWLKPTESEERSRLLTIIRYKNLIEHYYPLVKVHVQGSTATNTYLPTSDIDFIILGFPVDVDIAKTLKSITKMLWKNRVIVHSFVIATAKVPIAKCVDRAYGFHLDIALNNVGGAVNVPRVKNYIKSYPMIRPILIFMKFLCLATGTDDPANGGFGSNQLVNLCLFAMQSNKEAKTVGEQILYILDCIAHKINFFLCGITTVDGGGLFSKRATAQIDSQCPEAFICEDPQRPNIFFGNRTHQTIKFVAICKSVLEKMQTTNKDVASPFGSTMITYYNLLERRKKLDEIGELFETKTPVQFSRIVNDKSERDWDDRQFKQKEKNPLQKLFMKRSVSTPDGFHSKKSERKKTTFPNRSPQKKNVSGITKSRSTYFN